ncbi:hypothetical protein AB0M87_10595 [Streptomyces sp. NPDC051320]|uniref:hypothetical protein n=1 Tax=Streptomyces sp. NPDC051320 TaxID=3154644 RepID=UPI003412B4D6
MTRLIPLIMIALGIYFWLRARRKTAAYLERTADPGPAYPPGSAPDRTTAPDAFSEKE